MKRAAVVLVLVLVLLCDWIQTLLGESRRFRRLKCPVRLWLRACARQQQQQQCHRDSRFGRVRAWVRPVRSSSAGGGCS